MLSQGWRVSFLGSKVLGRRVETEKRLKSHCSFLSAHEQSKVHSTHISKVLTIITITIIGKIY
jgi:hypothetical protein